jgi:hypothetical protein
VCTHKIADRYRSAHVIDIQRMCVCAEFYPHGSHNTILSKDLSACLSCMLGVVLCEVSCANSSLRGFKTSSFLVWMLLWNRSAASEW